MKKYDELSENEKHNFEEFLILTFEFSEDELAAIDKQKPMTMDLFSSCLAKCTEWGLYKLFERLLDEYPDLTDKYVKAIDDANSGRTVRQFQYYRYAHSDIMV